MCGLCDVLFQLSVMCSFESVLCAGISLSYVRALVCVKQMQSIDESLLFVVYSVRRYVLYSYSYIYLIYKADL